MQKKLIALAIAGLVSAPAFAQSNVTIYGVADAGLAYGDHGEGEFQGVFSGVLSGSRLGFRGTEDLGNGLKAVFTLEQGFDIGNGSASPDVNGDSVFSRQAFVGLSGGFGTVSIGRQYAPGYWANYDAVLGAQVSPQSLLSLQTGASITPNSAARWDNSVAYNGMFSGLTVRAVYGMNAETNTFNTTTGEELLGASDDDKMGLGVDYSNGPLKVGAVYHFLNDAFDINGLTDDQQEWLVGGSYDFGVLTLAGSYQQTKNALFSDGTDVDIYQLGVIVPVGKAGNVHLAYGEADVEGANNFDGKTSAYTLAYTHALSKRTTAYAAYMGTDNDDGLAISLVNPGYQTVNGVGVRETGEKSNAVAVGIRHTF